MVGRAAHAVAPVVHVLGPVEGATRAAPPERPTAPTRHLLDRLGQEFDQVPRQLSRGSTTMPLRGVSLDPGIATSFGTRFPLEIVGDFPAVPAWVASGFKACEQELIAGGEYRLLSVDEVGGTTHARLQCIGAIGDRVGSDDVLLDVLAAVDSVGGSELGRVGGQSETLTVHLPGRGNWAEVIRESSAAEEVEVRRYYLPDDDPDALTTRSTRWNAGSWPRRPRRRVLPGAPTLAAIAAPRS
ncbi:hypothetical protein KUM42_03990 [Modestobacter sp. L9-4]|uniref:hypothetical protein n=1 Tax=Modestobacter sp. L9-4 TaxID=2851567 RepID=UPI001C78DDDA|nr:hypothetical protein [Modestobacter sp. L9-4]QXG76721.1 hypothetical protein KUM42_03990 [Modestobacter sp. L9-4]